jgi:hypothetical protein
MDVTVSRIIPRETLGEEEKIILLQSVPAKGRNIQLKWMFFCKKKSIDFNRLVSFLVDSTGFIKLKTIGLTRVSWPQMLRDRSHVLETTSNFAIDKWVSTKLMNHQKWIV